MNTRTRCIDALDRIDQKAKQELDLSAAWDYMQDVVTIRHSVEALTWVLQHTSADDKKLEVFVAQMCDTYGVEGP